jgi:hypothetical protein
METWLPYLIIFPLLHTFKKHKSQTFYYLSFCWPCWVRNSPVTKGVWVVLMNPFPFYQPNPPSKEPTVTCHTASQILDREDGNWCMLLNIELVDMKWTSYDYKLSLRGLSSVINGAWAQFMASRPTWTVMIRSWLMHHSAPVIYPQQ